MSTITISEEDRRDIVAMLDRYQPFLSTEVKQKGALRRKLEQAAVVPAAQLAPTVVGVNSVVRLVDIASRGDKAYTLVHPNAASNSMRMLSLLSPLGTAILGCDQGTIVELAASPNPIRFLIEEVSAPVEQGAAASSGSSPR